MRTHDVLSKSKSIINDVTSQYSVNEGNTNIHLRINSTKCEIAKTF